MKLFATSRAVKAISVSVVKYACKVCHLRNVFPNIDSSYSRENNRYTVKAGRNFWVSRAKFATP